MITYAVRASDGVDLALHRLDLILWLRGGFGPEDEPALVLSEWMTWNLKGRWVGRDGFDYLTALERMRTHAGRLLDPRADEECWPRVSERVARHATATRPRLGVAT